MLRADLLAALHRDQPLLSIQRGPQLAGNLPFVDALHLGDNLGAKGLARHAGNLQQFLQRRAPNGRCVP